MVPTESEARVFVVHLRRPTRDRDEMRSDPFWEFGSFGCTKCHSRNLLHPKNADRLDGARLAFVQGGRLGFRLVLLTPPVTVQRWRDRVEVRWRPPQMPFKYADAPLLVRNGEGSDFPRIMRMAESALRTTFEGGFSSRFRTRAQALPHAAAAELIAIYEHKRSTCPSGSICDRYDEALPYIPPKIDADREATYRKLLRQAGDRSGCGGTRRICRC